MGTDTYTVNVAANMASAATPDRLGYAAEQLAGLIAKLVDLEEKVDQVASLFGEPVAATLRPSVEATYETAVSLRSELHWATIDRDQLARERDEVVVAGRVLLDELYRRARRSGKPVYFEGFEGARAQIIRGRG